MAEAGSKNSWPTFCPDSHSKVGHELLDPASGRSGVLGQDLSALGVSAVNLLTRLAAAIPSTFPLLPLRLAIPRPASSVSDEFRKDALQIADPF
jgi:hypothetical protein